MHLSGNLPRNYAKYFYFRLAIIAFVLNWAWERAQMFAYSPEAGNYWTKSFLFCTLAAVGDSIVTIAIHFFLSFLVKTTGSKFYLSVAILGALCSIGFEWFAFRFGLWSYSEQMIVLPLLGIGLLPLVQLTLFVPLAIWLTKNFKEV